METRANHVLIGVFTLIGALVLVFGALWSSRWASNSQWQQLEVHFLQPLSGLSAGAEVAYNGTEKGAVRDLRLTQSNLWRAVVIALGQQFAVAAAGGAFSAAGQQPQCRVGG